MRTGTNSKHHKRWRKLVVTFTQSRKWAASFQFIPAVNLRWVERVWVRLLAWHLMGVYLIAWVLPLPRWFALSKENLKIDETAKIKPSRNFREMSRSGLSRFKDKEKPLDMKVGIPIRERSFLCGNLLSLFHCCSCGGFMDGAEKQPSSSIASSSAYVLTFLSSGLFSAITLIGVAAKVIIGPWWSDSRSGAGFRLHHSTF